MSIGPNKFAVFLLGCAACLQAADLGDYQLILDRQLLGALQPVTPQVPQVPQMQAPAWADDYIMTMISKGPSGLRVGLQHKRNGQAYLIVQDADPSTSDFELLSGNFDSGQATIRSENHIHTFSIQKGPAAARTVQAPVEQVNQPVIRPVRRSRSRNTEAIRAVNRENITQAQFKSREELQQHLREQQLDAIRTGKPPLPIPVTDEMVDQLIDEGWSLPEK